MNTPQNPVEEYRQTDAKYQELLDRYNTLIKVCKIVMHDIRSPLRFLGDVAESLDVDKLNEPGSDARKKLALVTETSRNLYFFGNNVLDWFINNKLEISVTEEYISLLEVAEEIMGLYEKSIREKNNRLVIDIDKNLTVYSNKELAVIILRNALDNANKYTQDGQITLKVEKKGDEVLFLVQDQGAGFDHKKLLDRLKDDNPSASQHIGFRIIHDLARQAGLEYTLYSERGKGTTFTLKFTTGERNREETWPTHVNL